MLAKLLHIGALVYIVAGVIAIVMVPASYYGWFGIEPDPLSGVFALILGLPWSLAANLFREPTIWFSLALCSAGIVINAYLLVRLARWVGG